MQNTHSKFGKLAILDELTKMCKGFIASFWYELDQIEHAFHNTALEVVAALVA